MGEYKKIVVAIDIEAEYEGIIEKALSISQSPKHITLVYIPLSTLYIQPYLYGANYGVLDDVNHMQRAHDKLEAIAKKYKISPKKTYVKAGYAAEEIKQYADDNDADLIVIGTHGRSGIKLLLGSTANAVLHGAKQDVLAVRVYDQE